MDDDIINIINNLSNKLKSIDLDSINIIEKEKLIFSIIEYDFEQLTLMYQDLILYPEKPFDFYIKKHPYLNIDSKEIYYYLKQFNYKNVFMTYMRDYYSVYIYEMDIIDQLLECYIEYLV